MQLFAQSTAVRRRVRKDQIAALLSYIVQLVADAQAHSALWTRSSICLSVSARRRKRDRPRERPHPWRSIRHRSTHSNSSASTAVGSTRGTLILLRRLSRTSATNVSVWCKACVNSFSATRALWSGWPSKMASRIRALGCCLHHPATLTSSRTRRNQIEILYHEHHERMNST
jgi:hypothetical protein